MRRLAAIVVLAVSSVLATGGPATASCVDLPLDDVMEIADGAFVGELLVQLPGPDRYHVVNIFKVEHVLKGELGSEVEVLSAFPWGGGLSVEEGLRYGLILWRNEGSWSSNRCSQLYSDELLREVALASAAATEAPPAAEGPAPSARARTSLMWLWVSLATGAGVLAVFLARRRARRAGHVP